MKKSMFFLILALGWLGLSAQKSLVYGPLDRTGFEKVSRGAFWSTRPWAKEIYEGKKLIPGYKVEILDQDHFVMFAQGENNPLDKNYIVFPEGEIIIEKDGIKYAAICGNKISSVRPVSDYANMVADTIEKTIILRDTVFLEKEVLKVVQPSKAEAISDEEKISIPTTDQPRQKWLKRNWWVWPVAAVLVGTASGFVLNKKGYYWFGYFPKPVPLDEGGPVGAPTHPADSGGPGGVDTFGSGGRR